MKITRRELERAAEALEQNEELNGLEASQVARMLWAALKSVKDRSPETVTLTVEATLSPDDHPGFVGAEDFEVRVLARTFQVSDMTGAKITKMEIGLWKRISI